MSVTALLGQPLDAPEVRAFLGAAKVPKPEDDDLLRVGSEARGFAVELVTAVDYDAEYVMRAAAKRRTTWVIAGVDLLGTGTNTKKTRAYTGVMPFGLAFGDAPR